MIMMVYTRIMQKAMELWKWVSGGRSATTPDMTLRTFPR